MTISRIVVIGHKDHGKSTLIGRILAEGGFIKPDRVRETEIYSKKAGFNGLNFAFLMDSFSEERGNGLTVDIAQARIRYKGMDYTLIDCPGHRELVKNMLSGASTAQSALLVVSAQEHEGVQEQTVRHLEIVRMLGIKKLAVAVTKMDACAYKRAVFLELSRTLRNMIKKSGFNPAATPIIPVSAKDGENIFKKNGFAQWFRGPTLMHVFGSRLSAIRTKRYPQLRFLVQDIYRIKNEDWAAGKIIGGSLSIGDKIVFMPGGIKRVIKRIKDGLKEVRSAGSEANAGLLLEQATDQDIKRGDIAGRLASAVKMSEKMAVCIIPLADSAAVWNGLYSMDMGLKNAGCVVSNARERGPAVFADIKIDHPVVMERYEIMPELGRFILKQRGMPVAAGIVKYIY